MALKDTLEQALGPSYTIERELGGGGMSRVFVADEVALGRKVVVKVLPPELTAALSLERFRREIRVAAGLQHPHIVPVLTTGEGEGLLYYTAPFIAGENLREQLDRERRLSVEQAVHYTCDVAEALGHAHEAGVVHRDVKPENILISGGHALLTDFGIAKAMASAGAETLTATGMSLGTPRYMAPEQASASTDVNARADIYSLGCVLYELLTGQPPFSGTSAQAVVAQHFTAPFPEVRHSRPDVPPAIDAAIRKATAKAPADRYASTGDFIAALTRATAAAPTSTRGAHVWKLALAAAAIALVAAGAFRILAHPALTTRDTILIADFVNRTGDTVFNGTLKQALAGQLRQTPFLTLFPDEGTSETLKLMERPISSPITREVGREICQRQGLKALIQGTITSLGTHYAITVEAISAVDGKVVASGQAEAEGKENVLRALQKSVTDLRRELGESLATIEKYNAPIEQATTSSLPALSAHAKGLESIYRGDIPAALTLFKRAVELDSTFASAYGWLSWTYANLSDYPSAAEAARKAYDLRARATEIERLHIVDLYFIWARDDWEKQLENDRQLQLLYPKDWLSYNNLAIGYYRFGLPEKALEQAREGIRVNPNEVHLYWHASSALIRLDRFAEARVMIAQGQARGLDHPRFRFNLLQAALALHDTVALREILAGVKAKDGEREMLLDQARIAAYEGRWRAAKTLLQQRDEAVTAAQGGIPSPIRISDVMLRAPLFGECALVEDYLSKALPKAGNVPPGSILYPPVGADGALCGSADDAERLADALVEWNPDALGLKVHTVAQLRAGAALKQGQPMHAIDGLRATRPYDGSAYYASNYQRGYAYLALKNGTQAAAEFQKIIDHRGWDVVSPVYPLAHLGLARALALSGERDKAKAAYDHFFAVWKNADATVPALVQARAEYAGLGR